MSEPEVPLQNMALDFSAKDPVCGMTLEPLQARGKAQYRGETYFFCSPGCMHKFTASPATYVTPRESLDAGAAAATVLPPRAKKLAKDPVCGMSVDPAKAASTAEYDGKLYHFCSRQCGEKFRKDPARYLCRQRQARGHDGHGAGRRRAGTDRDASRRLEKDPVCGMNVDPSAAASTVSHIGKTYYFCSRGCAEKFQADPGKYLSTASSTTEGAAKSSTVANPNRRSTYVCPMDPDIRQDRPGLVPSAAWRSSRSCRPPGDEDAVDLPHASRDRARRTRRLPDLRHGAGADDGRPPATRKIPNSAT